MPLHCRLQGDDEYANRIKQNTTKFGQQIKMVLYDAYITLQYQWLQCDISINHSVCEICAEVMLVVVDVFGNLVD